ncbi:MAG TPA: hypothetical protein VN176_15415 [Verrucomicrobiae bacterium]|nr:hypothetical protein [Verrucomicrobiae bacterium]
MQLSAPQAHSHPPRPLQPQLQQAPQKQRLLKGIVGVCAACEISELFRNGQRYRATAQVKHRRADIECGWDAAAGDGEPVPQQPGIKILGRGGTKFRKALAAIAVTSGALNFQESPAALVSGHAAVPPSGRAQSRTRSSAVSGTLRPWRRNAMTAQAVESASASAPELWPQAPSGVRAARSQSREVRTWTRMALERK